MGTQQLSNYVLSILILSNISLEKELKVFNFEESVSANGADLSYAVLSNIPALPLPDRFIICSSHIQKKIYDKNFYVLYDAEGIPWISLSIWESSGQISLWADLLYGIWFKLGLVNKPWTHFWTHICMEMDLKTGRISSSMNGNSVASVEAPDLVKLNTRRLNLAVGLSHHSWQVKEQFPDSVSNINIFTSSAKTDIQLMSSNPCKFAAMGDYLAWERMEWDKKGPNVREIELSEDEICDGSSTYKIALPKEMSWTETTQLCDNLGHGSISEITSEKELFGFVEWFNEEHGYCKDIWTPFNDEDKEGTFISAVTGMRGSYMPWMKGQPNGGRLQNHVAIRQVVDTEPLSLVYHDEKATVPYCGACSVDKRTVFILWGRCKNTFLGNHSLHPNI